ncbi:Transcription factor AP-2-alpha [Clarias magur]|uniref:Transcription factor AP-2-alpha n=1 Tax=Clarias magur TaxID=1594786 RepID=A0A8J4XB34_CLAMG|nr:Transcription factor AP-2-alpha [Clarias magur]
MSSSAVRERLMAKLLALPWHPGWSGQEQAGDTQYWGVWSRSMTTREGVSGSGVTCVTVDH